MEEQDRIELRSERIRNIIGDIPPKLTYLGTALIILIVAAIAVTFSCIYVKGDNLWYWMFGWVIF